MSDKAHRRPSARRRGATAARTGLVIALIMGGVSVAVVAYFLTTAPRRTRAGEQAASEAPPTAPDAGSLTSQPGRPAVALGTGKGLSVQIADRDDPTRLAGTITSTTLEPLEGNRYTAEKPESFIFLRDGRTIFVRADSARLYIPRSNQQPESGTLTGRVEISLFQARSGGVDPARDAPDFKFETDRFAFDLTAWQFDAPGDFRVSGPEFLYLGARLTLLVNQPQERVEMLRVAATRELRIKGDARPGERSGALARGPGATHERPAPAAPALASNQTAATPAAPPAAPDPAQPPTETFYHGVLTGTVRVARGTSSIESGSLDLWARFIDGDLPAGAIAPLDRGPKAAKPATPADAPIATGGQARAAPGAQPLPATAASPDPSPETVMTWAGPFELRPLDARPAELASDDVAVRFTAASEAPVRFADAGNGETGLSGVASRIDYRATSRRIGLIADTTAGVHIQLGADGRLSSDRLDIDLGSGIALVESPGIIAGLVTTGLGEPGGGASLNDARVVRWSDRAEFRFSTGSGGQGGTGSALLAAIMFGGVEAADGSSQLRGDAVAANFFEIPGGTGPISRLVVTGDARLEDGRGGGLFCDRLDASFSRREDRPEISDPRWVTASGSALAVRSDELLAADLIETTLERDADGRTQVVDMIADGNAMFQGKDGVWAEAPEIRASATREVAALSGPGSRVGREGSSVTGEQIELDGRARVARVFGAGQFMHRGQDGAGHPVHADASWSRSMTFDDRAGTLEARGDITAVMHPDEWTVRELEGATAMLELTPNPGAEGMGLGSDAGAPSNAEPRRVLRAEIIGASVDEAEGGRASVTSRTYEAADVPEGRRLAEELRVEGDRILADDELGTVDLPGAGTLRIVDVRAAPSGDSRPAREAPGAELSSRGAARFEWDGSLHLSREDGTVVMRERVRVRHLGLESPEMTEMEAEEVVAHLTDLRDDGTGGDVRGRLVRATAAGAVWARRGTKELTADRLEYLTTERLIRAASNEGNDVVMLDPGRPTPVRAKLLEWDLARDRVEVKSPGTIVIPR